MDDTNATIKYCDNCGKNLPDFETNVYTKYDSDQIYYCVRCAGELIGELFEELDKLEANQ